MSGEIISCFLQWHSISLFYRLNKTEVRLIACVHFFLHKDLASLNWVQLQTQLSFSGPKNTKQGFDENQTINGLHGQCSFATTQH